jgi:predicted signal transduction protein with EAL and GGDEF domain
VSRNRRATVANVVWVVLVAVALGLFAWAVPSAVYDARHSHAGFWSLTTLALLVDAPLFGRRRRAGPIRPTLSVCFALAMFLLYDEEPAIVLQAVAAVIAAWGMRLTLRSGAFLASRLVCTLAVVEVVTLASHWNLNFRGGEGLGGDRVLAFVLPALVWFAAGFGLLLLGTVLGLAGPRSVAESFRADILGTTVTVMLVTPLLIAMTGWWRVLVALPLLAWGQLAQNAAQYEEQTHRDPVTGLLNRTGLIATMDLFTAGDATTPETPRPFGIALVNTESVLGIERNLGREIFEKVVNATSLRLMDAFGSGRVGRLTGEGFVILIPDLTEHEASGAGQRVARILQPILEVDSIPFSLDPAAGISLSPQHGRDFDTLVARAATALVEARQLGQVTRVYVPESATVSQRRLTLLAELNAALRDPHRVSEIGVVYQPQVEVATRRLVGVEALVRWTHPEWGPMNTQELVTAIESTEVMRLLTRHVLATVVAQIRDWNAQNVPLRVAINVSVNDLHDPDFIPHLRRTMREEGVPARQLTVEITEGILVADTNQVMRAAADLTELGIGLSLDDFGTGYASLQQLRQLPLTEVKIDRSYVSQIVSDPTQHAIVLSVHQLARTLRLDVVAEGVEDDDTVRVLATLPATIGQGWYYARPMPSDELITWRAEHDIG